MNLFSICEVCKKRVLFTKFRNFKTKYSGTIKSKSEMCGGCKRNIKKKLKDI